LALLAVFAVCATVVGMVVTDRAGDTSRDPVTRADGRGGTGLGDPADDPGQVGSGSERGGDEASRSLVPGSSGRPALPTSTPATAASPATTRPTASDTPPASARPSPKPSPSNTGATNPAGSSGGSGGTGGGSTASGTPDAPDTPEGASTSEARVLAIVNDERADAGCGPVRSDASLRDLARAHSADMEARGYFDHNTPEGVTPWTRAERAGVTGLGAENIARGQKSAESVMRAWMNSPGHRANILDCTLTRLGVGVEEGDQGPWWTQEFGR